MWSSCCSFCHCCHHFHHYDETTMGIIQWIPINTDIGVLLCLDAENCFSDSLRGMSYISQSQSYAFKPGRGAVGRCWSTGCRQQVEIKKSTRFDEFHRSNVALDNGIFCVTLLYDNEKGVVYEYLNNTKPNTSLPKFQPGVFNVQ